MAAYIDSSFLLSIILGQNEPDNLENFWHANPVRVSSLLLDAECLIALRRLAGQNEKTITRKWLPEKQKSLNTLLEEISRKSITKTTIEILQDRKSLSRCRTLDAIHIATALEFRAHADENITICTLDTRMAAIASKNGFDLYPKSR